MILRAVEVGQGGTPLAILHGLFGAARNFGMVQKALAQRGRTIALDLRNHGDSPHAPDMTYADMAGDVIETLRALGALPCVLMGHSMGGKTAMRAALDVPASVAALIVSDIAPVPYPPHFEDYVAAMARLAPPLSRAAADAALADAVPEPRVRAFLLQNWRIGVGGGWRLNLDAIARALPALGVWDASDGALYPGPTQFIAGEQSDYIRPADHDAIRLVFPRARFAVVRSAGHWLHAENPNGFLSVVEAFLADL